MNLRRYAIPILTVLTLVVFCYLFSSVVIYILIAMVLTLIGLPIKQFIADLPIGKFRIPEGIAALVTLLLFIGIIFLIGVTFLPPLIAEVSFLSKLNFYDVMHNIFAQYPDLDDKLASFGNEEQIKVTVNQQLSNFINFKNVSYILNNTFGYLGTILGGAFAVLFITFFFLKDEKMVVRTLLLMTPTDYESEMKDILRTSKRMLSKYFTGMFIDLLFVSFTVTLSMWLFGVKNALVIGCLAGIMNIVPYIGPIITMIFAMFLGVSGCIEYNQYELIGQTMTKIFLILVGINLIDGIIMQPLIYSNSVKAHPLEIFLVILMASAIGGIVGMVVAIPAYTLIRIIAKEFLVHLKFFKKLTDTIPEL